MPEAITIKQEETEALSPENQEQLQGTEKTELKDSPADLSTDAEQQPEQKLAGKYDSVEELEKAYQELQQKMSKGEETPEQESTEDQPQSAKEIYGDYIGERFEQAGIKYEEMNEHFQKEGTLTSEQFEELNKAGFTKEVVESYLAGIQQKSAVTEQQIYDIKEEYGGDVGYANMMEWAGQTLSDAEKSAFSVGINNPNIEVVKLTVAGLHSKYVKATGTEPNLIGGKTPSAPSEKFESHDQLVRAMNDEKYSTDPAYRKMIERKISNSSIF
tara:strand:+ start:6820 stop:7635 length:816 start_codon:yes stop_codon:yes gene_type:complete